MGKGSVDVMRKQWYRQSAGRWTDSCHFFETDSTAISSGTLRYLKILNTRLGERLPTMSYVDLAYFSSRRICRRISPGIHESRMTLILLRERKEQVSQDAQSRERGDMYSRIRSSLLSKRTARLTSISLNVPSPLPLSAVARSTSPPCSSPSSSRPLKPLQ